MRNGIKLAHIAQAELDDSFAQARRVWTDATATRFSERFYKPVCELFRDFENAAAALNEAIEEAEAECRH